MNNLDSLSNEKKYSYISQKTFSYDKSTVWDLETISSFFDEDFINYLYDKRNIQNYITDITSYINFEEFLLSPTISNDLKNKLLCYLMHNYVNVSKLMNYNKTFIVDYLKKLFFMKASYSYYVFDMLSRDELKEFIETNIDNISIKKIADYINYKVNQGNYDSSKLKMLIQLEGIEEELVKSASPCLFWEIEDELGLSEECVKKRQQLDNAILSDPHNYNDDTVKKAFCDLYFKNDSSILLLDIETIIGYYKKNEKFREKISPIDILIELVNDFLKKDTLEDELNTLTEIIKSSCDVKSPAEVINSIERKMFKSFESEMNERLTKTKENITKNITPQLLKAKDGNIVQFYSIENQSEYQKEFLFLTHSTECEENAALFTSKYLKNGKKKNKLCLSLIDNGFIGNYNSNNEIIILGYFGTGEKNVLSVNTSDGQTNQRKIASNKKRKVIKNEVLPIEDFMKNTINYNEVTLYNQNQSIEPLIPDFIITKNTTPTEFEIEVANKFNIPIFYINKEKYKQYPSSPEKNNIWYNYHTSKYLSPEEIEKATTAIANKL